MEGGGQGGMCNCETVVFFPTNGPAFLIFVRGKEILTIVLFKIKYNFYYDLWEATKVIDEWWYTPYLKIMRQLAIKYKIRIHYLYILQEQPPKNALCGYMVTNFPYCGSVLYPYVLHFDRVLESVRDKGHEKSRP